MTPTLLPQLLSTTGLWIPINQAPTWAEKAADQYETVYQRRHRQPPLWTTKHFYGKSFIYRCTFITREQGTIYRRWSMKHRHGLLSKIT